jgi:hypothetical protein
LLDQGASDLFDDRHIARAFISCMGTRRGKTVIATHVSDAAHIRA